MKTVPANYESIERVVDAAEALRLHLSNVNLDDRDRYDRYSVREFLVAMRRLIDQKLAS